MKAKIQAVSHPNRMRLIVARLLHPDSPGGEKQAKNKENGLFQTILFFMQSSAMSVHATKVYFTSCMLSSHTLLVQLLYQ